MKSQSNARGLSVAVLLLAATASPAVQAQSTNVINDGTSAANLTLLANLADTSGATLTLTPDNSGALLAEQSPEYADFPLNGVWFDDGVRPATNAYTVLADVLPAAAYPENVVGLMGWLDTASSKGIAFRVVPGAFGAFQLAAIDFTAATPDVNDSTTGLYNLDGTDAQPYLGSAWAQTGSYDPASFATLSLAITRPTTADLAAVTNATAHLTAKVFQPADTQAGDAIELLTTLPVPATHRFGYAAKFDTLFAAGGPIGYFKNLRVVGNVEIANRPPQIAITSPTNTAQFYAPATFTVTAEAQDKDGQVTRVDFFQDATPVGTVSNQPNASVTVSNLVVGTYSFTAKAYDNAGAVTTSAPITVSVVASLEPTLKDFQIVTGPDGLPQVKLTVVGTAGTAYDAQVSFDLNTWFSVATGTLPAASTDLVFPSYSYSGLAYYRVQVAKPPGQGNQSPSVAISSPAAGAQFPAPATISVTANAQDSDGQIQKVEVYLGTQLVGSATTNPATITVANVTPGSYQLTARAFDDQGAAAISQPVPISVSGTVTPPQLSGPTPLPSAGDFQQFQFTVTGLSGSAYRVESSPDLQQWTQVETGAVTGATRQFSYPRATGGNALFYRVVSLP